MSGVRTAAVHWMRFAPLVSLLAAHGLSLAGNAVTLVVIPLYVLQVTGSVFAAGVAGVFATVPMIVGGALGGVLVDRLGFRRSAIAADLASGLTVLAIPVLAATVGLPFWALLTLVFLSGVLDTPGNTAKESLLPDLADSCDVRLTRATGAASAISRSAMMVGASVAAVSVVWLGPLNSLLLDAVSFAVSAALLWSGVPARTAASAPEEATALGFWREFADGVRYLAAEPLIRNLVLMIVVTNCFDAAGMLVLKPVYARTVSPDGSLFGIMVACFAFGALAGAGLFGWFGHRLPPRLTLVVCFILAGPPTYIAMALDLPVPALLSVFVLAGLSAGSINPLLDAMLYAKIPRAMRARVLGALTTGVTAGMPLGSLLGGVAVEKAGLLPTLIVVAAAYALVTLAPTVGRSWRQLDTKARVVTP
ncbi:MFS transporter [Parafrigoribacterium mesophilum]|uniref:MFS transporter n=1 Tax=Parafrigoribacterium mesophilum TaxID=433646 RepID=UPI0031FC14F8